MAIKDRTPRTVGLSRAGIIRLGRKVPVIDKQTGRQKTWKNGQLAFRPANSVYFVLDDAPAVANAYAGVPGVEDEHGSGPTELLVFLPFGDPEQVLPTHYELWKSGGNICRGDGQHIVRAWDRAGLELLIDDGFVLNDYTDQEWSFDAGAQVPCSGSREERYYPRCQDCRLSVILRVLVRDPRHPDRLVADDLRYYQIRTHSATVYDRLSQQIAAYANMAERFNVPLSWVPLRLVRSEQVMSFIAEGRGGRQRQQSSQALLSLEPSEEWVRAMSIMMHSGALSLSSGEPAAAPAALPAGEFQQRATQYELVESLDDPGDDGHSQAGEVIEGEFEDGGDEEEPPEHWIDRPAVQARFWRYACDELQLSTDEVRQALGVEDVHAFEGDMLAAREALDLFADAKRTPPGEDGQAGEGPENDGQAALDEAFPGSVLRQAVQADSDLAGGELGRAIELLEQAEAAGVELDEADVAGTVERLKAWRAEAA
jgi:hypothetical protein